MAVSRRRSLLRGLPGCDDRELGVARVKRVAEAVRRDSEPLGAADAVLDPDMESAQASVAILLFLGQLSPFRFLPGHLQIRVLTVVALVGAVGVEARASGQPRPLAANRQVVAAAGVKGQHAGDVPGGGDDALGFDGVASLLARITRPLPHVAAASRSRAAGSAATCSPRSAPWLAAA